ncbi:MAG TPA: hypothetical protein VHE60_14400 [Pyrinomonadaceae bacterium]|nr:hypothetical protein [Pyrinomonadaceae bacterium]
MTERIWIIVAGLFVVAAAVFLWRNNLSAAFVSAALGAVAWFLSYRSQLRARIAAAERDSGEQQTSEESDEK